MRSTITRKMAKQLRLQPCTARFPSLSFLPCCFHCLVLLFHFQLILLPHFLSTTPFIISLFPHERTGKDTQAVVVLAVWHYQLINPCQQLVCLLSSLPVSIPSSPQWWRSGGTQWPTGGGSSDTDRRAPTSHSPLHIFLSQHYAHSPLYIFFLLAINSFS